MPIFPFLGYFPLSPALQGTNSRLQMLSIRLACGAGEDLRAFTLCPAELMLPSTLTQLYKAPGSIFSCVYPSRSSHSQLLGPEETLLFREGLLGISLCVLV